MDTGCTECSQEAPGNEAMNTSETLDEVIFAFHRAVDIPTPAEVAKWTRDYPQFADEIRAHAVEIIDMEMLAASAPVADAVTPPASEVKTLREVIREGGLTLPDFADELDISSAVVSDVNSGRILTHTVPAKFVRLAATFLRQSVEDLAAVVAGPKERPALALLKAKAGPVEGQPVTWEEAIHSSDMDDDRKAFWLSYVE